jgi:hypothetical protein
MMNVSPPDKLGAVSGLFTMLRFTIGSVGTTSMGLLLQTLVDHDVRAGLPVVQATVAGMHVVFAITASVAFAAFLVVLLGWRAAARYYERALTA